MMKKGRSWPYHIEKKEKRVDTSFILCKLAKSNQGKDAKRKKKTGEWRQDKFKVKR